VVAFGGAGPLVLSAPGGECVQPKITGAEVHETESGELAAALMQRTVLHERCYRHPLVLHADNGAAMKSQTLQAKLVELNISPSHSRPRVSNDNSYVESLFRTLKYVPQWPSLGFKNVEEARVWVDKLSVGIIKRADTVA
jgi:putative transposase